MFADFRIANSQGTAVSRLPTEKLTTKLSKIILPVHDKAQPQQSSTAENWLVRPEKNTDSAYEAGPAFSRDLQNIRLASLVNEKFANFSEISIKAASNPYARFQAAWNCLDFAPIS